MWLFLVQEIKVGMEALSVLIVSCDKYSDLWPYFFRFFEIHWPDCPFPILLGSNHKIWSGAQAKTICVGDDKTWATNLRYMLEKVETPWVMVLLEDFFLVEDVTTQKVRIALSVAQKENSDCLRLAVSKRASVVVPATVREYEGLQFGHFLKGTPYRISTQGAIWKRQTLMALLDESYSAWDFEIIGTQVAEQLEIKILGVFQNPILKYRHAVERGKWLPQGIENCTRVGLEIDYSKRPALSQEELSAMLARGKNLKSWIVKACVPQFVLKWRQGFKLRKSVQGALLRTGKRLKECNVI